MWSFKIKFIHLYYILNYWNTLNPVEVKAISCVLEKLNLEPNKVPTYLIKTNILFKIYLKLILIFTQIIIFYSNIILLKL